MVSGTDELPIIKQAGLWMVVDSARNGRTALIVAEKRFLRQRRFDPKTSQRIDTHNRVEVTADCCYEVKGEKAIDIYVRQSILPADSTMREQTCTKYCCGEPVLTKAMPRYVRLA